MQHLNAFHQVTLELEHLTITGFSISAHGYQACTLPIGDGLELALR